MAEEPKHILTIKHKSDSCEDYCLCSPSRKLVHLKDDSCSFYGPCKEEHDYQGFDPSPWEGEDAPWEGSEDWTFHEEDHAWIDGEWMVEETGRCAFVEGFCFFDEEPNDGSYSVRIDWDGETWEAVIVEKLTEGVTNG